MSIGALLLVAASAQIAGLLCRRSPRLWLAAMLLGSAASLSAAILALASPTEWIWRSTVPIGTEPVYLRLDGISGFFLVLLAVVSAAGAVYAGEYWSDSAHPRSAATGRLWWSALVVSLGFVLIASNGLHFLFGWELFTISAYFLVTLDRRDPAVRAAGWLYLGASHVAMVCLFAFFAALAAHHGGSWDLGPIRDEKALAPLFWLALIGFGLKAGMFPLHIWLPSAHANAPSHVSAILSGVTIKLGIYGLVRFSAWLPIPVAAAWTIALLGVTSAVLGVAFALGQHDLKRLLAYHSVENIGIILIGLGFALVAASGPGNVWGRLALAGGLLHVWNHGLFKSLLFLGAGSVLHATGTREMSRLGGLWRAMPWTASLFALGAAAISGLPPLNGFVSEWLVFLGLFDGALTRGAYAWTAVPAAILLGVTGALALACFVKVCGVVFLGAPRSVVAEHAHESGPAMRSAMLLLAAGCVAIGLAPVVFWPALARAVSAWESTALPQSATSPADLAPVAPLAALSVAHVAVACVAAVAIVWLWRRAHRKRSPRALTWDCGYALPTARMQYTAGSFAAIITEWFGWILRPQQHAEPPVTTFPHHASFETHTPETVLDYVVVPAGGVVMQLSSAARRLQHGRLSAYLLYLLVGVGALALIVALENRQ